VNASQVSVLGFAGSLRRASYNRGLLRAARNLAPKGMEIDVFGLEDIPLYDEDAHERGFPESVALFRERIRSADALLIVTPEYNYSVPGVLKNAIDWVSRPPEQPFEDKPIAIMGASTGMFGTTRAQHHLRQIFVLLDARVLCRPEVTLPMAKEKFNADGELVDGASRSFVVEHLRALDAWTRRLKSTRGTT
jgi:chromate reductase